MMRRAIAGVLRCAASRLDPPRRIEIHSVVTPEDAADGAALRDALLKLQRRNGGLGLG